MTSLRHLPVGYLAGKPSKRNTQVPTLVIGMRVNRAIQRFEPLHARAGRRYQHDGWLPRVEVLRHLLIVAWSTKVEPDCDVEVQAVDEASSYRHVRNVGGSAASLSNVN